MNPVCGAISRSKIVCVLDPGHAGMHAGNEAWGNGGPARVTLPAADIEKIREALEWAIRCFETATAEGLLGGSTEADAETAENMRPIRAALALLPVKP